jgi:hypothetical protein
MNARAPVKVLSRVGRANRRSGGRLSRPRTTVPEPETDRLDEQLSALRESIEVELSERVRFRKASRAPYVSTSAFARPLGRAQSAGRRVDPIIRARIVEILAGVMMGILVAFVVIWFLQGQAR